MRTEVKVKIFLFTVFVIQSSALSDSALYISAQLSVVMSCAQRR
jgi:hypothetical protein